MCTIAFKGGPSGTRRPRQLNLEEIELTGQDGVHSVSISYFNIVQLPIYLISHNSSCAFASK